MQNYPEDSDVEIAARLLRGEKQEQAVRQMDHPAQKVYIWYRKAEEGRY